MVQDLVVEEKKKKGNFVGIAQVVSLLCVMQTMMLGKIMTQTTRKNYLILKMYEELCSRDREE